MSGKRSVYFKREQSRSREPSQQTHPLKSRNSVKSKHTLSKNTRSISKNKLSKETVSKITASKTATKTPISRGTLTKTPISKDSGTKTPITNGTLTKTPISNGSGTNTKTPISRGTVSTTPKSKKTPSKTPDSKRRKSRASEPKEVEPKSTVERKYPWEAAKYDKVRESSEKDEDDDLDEDFDPKMRLCFVDKREKESNEKELVEMATDEIGRFDPNIENLYYFHGFLAREEAEALLAEDGDFLIRECEFNNLCHYVISAQHKGKVHHILVKTTRTKKLFWTYKYAFRSIVDLAVYHSRFGITVYKDIVLIRGVGKQGWQINHEQVELKGSLGDGQFGEVFKGVLKTHVMRNGIVVAVKKLKPQDLSGKQKQEFLKEARTMLSLRHPNVARLYGVCTMRQPIMLVLEFCDMGALDGVLKKKVSTTQKVTYLYHAACGLEYLHEKTIIHRDIAARNCLVTAKNVVKISDFGLSNKGVSITEIAGHKPILYMAPEAFRNKYCSASDMFSYTALMYEVMSDGKMPFDGVYLPPLRKECNNALANMKIKLDFKPPLDTPTYIYNIYDNCRVKKSKSRLTAAEVVHIFEMQGDCEPIKPDTFMQRMKEKWKNMFIGFHL